MECAKRSVVYSLVFRVPLTLACYEYFNEYSVSADCVSFLYIWMVGRYQLIKCILIYLHSHTHTRAAPVPDDTITGNNFQTFRHNNACCAARTHTPHSATTVVREIVVRDISLLFHLVVAFHFTHTRHTHAHNFVWQMAIDVRPDSNAV